MAHNRVKSLTTFAGDDSQASQNKLLFLMQEHGVGVTTSSPILGNEPQSSIKALTRAPAKARKRQLPQPQSASDASADAGTVSSSRRKPRPTTRQPRLATLPLSELKQVAQSNAETNAQPVSHDACPAEKSPHSLIREDAPTESSSPTESFKKRTTRPMSSQSMTQSNEGRSYEQYLHNSSQPSSPPRSPTQDPRTLREGDTGYVDFRYPFELPDTTPVPETPATLPKSFLSGGEQLIGPSQLFDQTQPTSGLKKASPTSSRPSPNVLRNNATSPIHPISSPLKTRGLGISALPDCPPTSPDLSEHSPKPLDRRTSRRTSPVDVSDAARDREGSERGNPPSPELVSCRGKTRPEPIEEYQPYRKQALDRGITRSSSQSTVDSDFERDEAELRRRRAKSKKERASRSFPEISIPPGLDKTKVEVPSTNRTKSSRSNSASRRNPIRYHEKYPADNGDSQETVADSQDLIVQQQSTNSDVDPAVPNGNQGESDLRDHNLPSLYAKKRLEEEEIPETSPARTPTELSRTVGDVMLVKSSASSGLPLAEENATHQLARVRYATPSLAAAPDLLEPSGVSIMSSAVSILSTTPSIASGVTERADDGRGREVPDETATASSSVADKINGRGRSLVSLPDESSLPSSTSHSRSRQSFRIGARRSSRHSSLSLNEVNKSNASAAKNSHPVSRKPSRKPTSLRECQTRRGMFEGMVFAISFRDDQQPQKIKDKALSKRSLEDMIRQEGGKILDEGFNPLFEFDTLVGSVKSSPVPMLSNLLKLLDDTVGFAALIADGHSRKVKYMQALALGIPCLAPRWVTTCVLKQEIVDWSSYLLCAGSSTLLGDAIRSRNLLPYDASTTKLVDVISKRPKLLDGSKILLIMKKTKNDEKRLPYVFLAQVLGASLVRVHSIEEARTELREAESRGEAFDWVYVNDQVRDARTALFGICSSEKPSKKRGRASSTATDIDHERPPKRIRTLNDELVIQSLILGRLIEEDELDG
ncbi:hypothetical protein GGS21DRAFT_495073 [Xylaria nigripes]|nr:hypothetical protein GGS21DRAFT_495073 [Xylaria nigripes]